MDFDAALTGTAEDGIFGLPFTEEESELVLLPVPWEVTTSYGGGTSEGPKAILEASPQIDLFDLEAKDTYKRGIFLREASEDLCHLNTKTKDLAQEVIELITHRQDEAKQDQLRKEINAACQKMVSYVYDESQKLLNQNKLVGLVGGDHSTPLGLIQALSEREAEYGILHVDAHADLRSSYQGFTHSHASIMDNVLQLKNPPKKLVQLGIRDFCEEEFDKINNSGGRVKTLFDQNIKEDLYSGKTWLEICRECIQNLPTKVYISFDIDGLSPAFCPNTGTPVPGGLDFNQAVALIHEIVRSGREIIGFDLVEVAPDPENKNEWDGNVGARLLYKMSCLALMSRRR